MNKKHMASRLFVIFTAALMISNCIFVFRESPSSVSPQDDLIPTDSMIKDKGNRMSNQPDSRSELGKYTGTEISPGTSPISPPILMTSEILGYGPTRLALTVRSFVDAKVSLEFDKPELVKAFGSEPEFHAVKGEARTFLVTMAPQKEQDYSLEITANWKVVSDSASFTSSHVISFKNGVYVPAHKNILGADIISSPPSQAYNSEIKRSTRAVYTVKGVFQYEDRELDETGFTGVTSFMPVRYADVELVDVDSGEVLGGSFTNETGGFDMTISDSTVRNLTVVARTSSFYHTNLFNQSVRTVPATGENVYELSSPVYANHPPGTDIDFTNQPVNATKDGVGGPFHIFDLAEFAENYIENLTDKKPIYNLTVNWEEGYDNGKYYNTYGHVYLIGTSSDDDSYDDSVILHEVGHYIALTYSADAGVYGDHSLSGVYDIRLTYTEGLGSYFMGAVRNFINASMPMVYIETNGVNLRWYGFAMPHDSDTPSGYTSNPLDPLTAANEVTVAHALFDIVDTMGTDDGTPGTDDDPFNLPDMEGDQLVWNVLISIMENKTLFTKEISMETFFDTWMNINPYTSEFLEVLVNHKIEYTEDPYEQDDDYLNAKSKETSGISYHHTFFGEDDPDWSVFSGVSGEEYVFKTTDLLDGADTVLNLYDSDGTTLLISNNDKDTSTTASLLSFAPAVSNQYYIECYRFTESPKPIGKYGNYNLTAYILRNPKIISVLPSTGDVSGGTDVTITGSNFSAGARVFFGIYEAVNVNVLDENNITATTPANIPGAVNVTVINPPNPDGVIPKGTLANGFTYTGAPLAPIIHSISPDFGSTVSQTNVTVSGDYIINGAVLYFNTIECADYTVVDPKTIAATVQPLPQDIYDVNVSNPDGQYDILKKGFESLVTKVNNTATQFDWSGPVETTIQVGEDFIISDLYVYLNLTYLAPPAGIVITLQSPSGKTVAVFDRIEVAEDGIWRTNMTSYFGYNEAPSEGLWQFKGESTKGLWRLNLSAIYTYGENCTLHSWSLHFFRFRHREIQRVILAESQFRNYLMAFDEKTGEMLYRARLKSQYYLYDPNTPHSVAVSRNQKYVYAGAYKDINQTTMTYKDTSITVFEMMTGRYIKTFFLNGSGSVDAVETAADADRAVVATSHYLYVINTVTNQIEGTMQLPGFSEGIETHLGVAPNGSIAYIANAQDEYVLVIDLDTLTVAGQIPVPGYSINDVDISQDGTFGIITTWGDPNVMYRFSTSNYEITETLNPPGPGTQAAITYEGMKVFYTQYQYYAGFGVVNLSSKTGNTFWPHPEATTHGIAAARNDRAYVTDYLLARIWIFDTATEISLGEIDTLDGLGPAGIASADIVGKITDLQAVSGDGYVQLGWSVPESMGSSIIRYDIYRGGSSYHEEFYSTTTTPYFIDLAVTNGVTYYYRVSAVNLAGEGGLSNEASGTPEGDSVFLRYGWNLISIPKIQSDTSLDTVLLNISGAYNNVQWYNVSDAEKPWKLNSAVKPAGENDLTDIDQTMAIWIFITEQNGTLFRYPGVRPVINQTIVLHPGWNLVGYPSFAFHNRTTGLNNVQFGPDVDAIQWYDAAAGSWHFMGPEDLFVPGRGFWIHSLKEISWEVPL